MKVYIARDKKTKDGTDCVTISDTKFKFEWNKRHKFWIPKTKQDCTFNYYICYKIFCIVSKIRLKKGQQRYLDIELIGKEIIE
jgi:hypothetical protein